MACMVVAQQAPRVDDGVLKSAARSGDEWLTYGQNPGETRYSPLQQIDATNVSRLGLAWSYDVGQGGGSFKWSLAVPMIKDGFIPDSISTDLHITSMNGAMKDELNVADKIMAVNVPLKEVVAEMTSHPAHEIRHDELGNLSEGAIADVAVLRVENGKFGFTDMVNRRLDGKQKLICELTIKGGKIVYDLNGISAQLWTAPPGPNDAEAYRWTTFAPRPRPSTPATTEMPH